MTTNAMRWLLLCGLLGTAACTRAQRLGDAAAPATAGAGGTAGTAGRAGAARDSEASDAGGFAHSEAGSTPPDDPSTLDAGGGDDAPLPVATTRWAGNADGCPASAPQHGDPCEIAEGDTCAYYWEDPAIPGQTFYSECACRAFCGSSATELHWDCYRNIGASYMACPPEQPEDGSSCFGLKGYECYYPTSVSCRCPNEPNEDSWECASEASPVPDHPSVVDEDKLVRDLTDEEREAWCAWYAPVEPGFPAPPELEPTADGFYPDTGCNSSGDFLGCAVSRPTDLPASACVANLALSTCEASVRELNDCVLSMRWFEPAPFGCARYLDAPGCSGTLVNGHDGGGAGSGGSFGGAGGGSDANACLVRVR
jgi:hypothetical protein